ncbi:MAG: acyltransferase family protein [Actinomycetota bacterium]
MTASVPEQERAFPGLNAVRAVAALGVVATHTAFDTGEVHRGALGAFLSRLDFGVTLFFVLSGFLLSRPFFVAASRGLARPSYRHFLWKRALRILPLYWLTVVAALLLLPENRGSTSAGEWLANLTLTQIYTTGSLPAGLSQMWSLATEVAFYVLLPAIAAALVGRRWAPGRALVALAVVVVLGFAWQVVAASNSDPLDQHYHQWLPGFMPWFGVGIAFALVSVHAPSTPAGSRWQLPDRVGQDVFGSWFVGAAVFAIACTPVAGPRLLETPTPFEAGAKSLLYTVSAAFFVLPLVFGPEHGGLGRRIAATPFAVWLGDISYGIFSLHLIVLEATMAALGVDEFEGGFQTVFVVTVAGTILLAGASFYVLERPLLRLKNRGPFVPSAPRAAASARSASS